MLIPNLQLSVFCHSQETEIKIKVYVETQIRSYSSFEEMRANG